MTILQHQATHELEVHRCWTCGNYWACEERGGGEARCPSCAGERILEIGNELAARDRTIAALKGALTKARGRR